MDTQQTLGRSQLVVPRLGIGVMTWGDAKGSARLSPAKLVYGGAEGSEEEQAAFQTSMAAGVTLFDTAALYGNGASERRLGQLAQGSHALIATKFPASFRASTEDFPRDLEASLARLDRGILDLYQHHFPSNRMDIPRLMAQMADAVDAGKVRAVGVSNYTAAQMRQANAALAERGIPLASNQVEYSLLHRQPETDGVLDACRELGITLIAYTPLAGGALTGKYTRSNRPRGLRRFFMGYFGRANEAAVAQVVELLREIGARYDKSPAQVALRWLLENDAVLPIPGAKNSRQAASNAAALSFRLTPDEVEELNAATQAWRE
jgi:aryl-alcohol dehydrogenase-like predicted oxidoreductase